MSTPNLVAINGGLFWISSDLLKFKLRAFSHSSSVRFIGVNTTDKQLFIEFRNTNGTAKYIYNNVSLECLRRAEFLMGDDSVGKFVHAEVRSVYKGEHFPENYYIKAATAEEIADCYTKLLNQLNKS